MRRPELFLGGIGGRGSLPLSGLPLSLPFLKDSDNRKMLGNSSSSIFSARVRFLVEEEIYENSETLMISTARNCLAWIESAEDDAT